MKKIFFTIIALTFCILNAMAQDSNIEWNISRGTLAIAVTGAMPDYNTSDNTPPWHYYQEHISGILIGEGITSIGANAFYECSDLLFVELPNSITTIGDYVFYGCRSLTEVTIPNAVTSIGEAAFRDCRVLTYITIPNAVTHIGGGAFAECSMLSKINITKKHPAFSVVDNVLFNKDKSVLVTYLSSKTVNNYQIPARVTTIGKNAFNSCNNLTSITIPNSVVTIDEGAFSDCGGLTSIIIPNSVNTIGRAAFYACTALTSITISSSVVTIGELAFYFCRSLTVITNHATTPQSINANVFTTVNKSACTLRVPAASVAAYRAADGWKDFANIVGI
jgi:hypothetical protein